MQCSWETICPQESCDFEVDLILGILAASGLPLFLSNAKQESIYIRLAKALNQEVRAG